MEWLNDMFVEMDWRQFIPSLVATIIGIFGPFWIQRRIEKSNKKKDALSKVDQLKIELKSMLKTIGSLEDDKRYIDPIKTPIWTGLQNTNESSLLSVLRKKPKTDKDKKQAVLSQDNTETKQIEAEDGGNAQTDNWYKAVYSLYGRIEEYNKWWNLYSTQRAAGRTPTELHAEKECIAGLKEKLCAEQLPNDEAQANEENEQAVSQELQVNKDGIPFLLNLLDEVIAVNTPFMQRLANGLRKVFRVKTNKKKSK